MRVQDTAEEVVMVRWMEVVRDDILDRIFERLSMVRLVETPKMDIVPGSSVVASLSHRRLAAWTLGLTAPSYVVVAAEDYVVPSLGDLDSVYLHLDSADAMDIDP